MLVPTLQYCVSCTTVQTPLKQRVVLEKLQYIDMTSEGNILQGITLREGIDRRPGWDADNRSGFMK